MHRATGDLKRALNYMNIAKTVKPISFQRNFLPNK